MSGGIAYVYDQDQDFKSRCNMDMVQLEAMEEEDIQLINDLLYKHYVYQEQHRPQSLG